MVDFSIYPILDIDYINSIKKNYIKVLHDILKSKIGLIQLRYKSGNYNDFLKKAKIIKKICKKYKTILIINDRIDIAKKINADGVHIGQDDLNPVKVRKILGVKKIIGYSVTNKREAKLAEKMPVDYIGLGPVFPTETKKAKIVPLQHIKSIIKNYNKPVIAIGGIKEYNIIKLKKIGLKNFAFISEICGAKDITKKIKKLKKIIKGV
jgi:thiamine-phosphate pyrophosphorylase